jgi:hypothetical protein
MTHFWIPILLIALSVPAIGQSGADERPEVRFLAERQLAGVEQVVITGEKGPVGTPFAPPLNHLTEPMPAPARAFTLQAAPGADGGGAEVARISLPAEGRRFIVILLPDAQRNFRSLVIRADDQGFRPGDVYFHNQSTATIVGKIGARPFEIEPGKGRIETPRPDGDRPFIDVAFGYRVEGEQARVLSTTRWPIDNRVRGYVFFFVDPATKRLTYRAVDEFVPPDPPANDAP